MRRSTTIWRTRVSDALPFSLTIGAVNFTPEGDQVVISYMDLTNDVRNRGLLQQTHQIAVSRGVGTQDYAEEFDALHDAAMALLVDALEDFKASAAYESGSSQPPDDDEDDED